MKIFLLLTLLFISTASFGEEFKCWKDNDNKKFLIHVSQQELIYNNETYKFVGMYNLEQNEDIVIYMYYNNVKKYIISINKAKDDSYDFVMMYGIEDDSKWDSGYCMQK